MMSPTFSFLLGLVALIPSSLSMPASAAGGLSLVPGDNPLPPSPGDWYDIPGTTLSIHAREPYGPGLASLQNALLALTTAQRAIAASQSPTTQLPHTPQKWQTTSSHIHLSASAAFRHLGTYGQLVSALQGLGHLLSTVGARQITWYVSDEVTGLIIMGEIRTEWQAGNGRSLLAGNGTATATNTTAGEGEGTRVAGETKPKISITAFRLLNEETS